MKRSIYIVILAAFVAAVWLYTPTIQAKNTGHKIAICHVPPGNPENAHVVVIDVHAWPPDGPGHTPHQYHALDYELGPDDVCPPDDGEPEGPGPL